MDQDALKAYQEYLASLPKDEKGNITQPISPVAENQARNELALGAKGNYIVYGDELPAREKFAGMPEGHLYKTELSEQQMREALEFFESKTPDIKNWIDAGFINTKAQTTLEDTLKQIKAGQQQKLTEEEILFYPEIILNLNKLITFEIHPQTKTFDLLQEIAEKTRVFKHVLETKKV